MTVYLADKSNNEVMEYDGATKLPLRVNAFDPAQVAPVGMVAFTNGANPVPVFNHFDRLGSVIVTSSAGGSGGNGTVTGQYGYLPWGESAALVGTGFGYAAESDAVPIAT